MSGDAGEAAVLVQGHVARAGVLVVAIPDASRVRRMVEIARALNPGIEILLRTHSDEETELFTRDRLGTVFMGEERLAAAMAAFVLEHRETPSS